MQKNEKKGWIFRKTKLETTNSLVQDTVRTVETEEEEDKPAVNVSAVDEAVAEIVKLTATPSFIRRHWAAIIIQTAFRGYLVSTKQNKKKEFLHLEINIDRKNGEK